MKSILERVIKQKNPAFSFSHHIGNTILLKLALGYSFMLVRGIFQQLICLKIPKMVFMERRVHLKHPSYLSLGNGVRLEKNVSLSAFGSIGLTIADNSRIGAYSQVIVGTSLSFPGKFIRIGKDVGIGEFAYLGGGGGLEIGDNCIIGQYFSCHPENHNYLKPKTLIRKQGVNRKGIIVGPNCWIGSKVTILDGVEIGHSSVVAAGTIVTKTFPPHSVIAGVPARLIKAINPKL